MLRSAPRLRLTLRASFLVVCGAALFLACEQYPTESAGDLTPPAITAFGVTPDSANVTRQSVEVVTSVGVRAPAGADSVAVILVAPDGEAADTCTSHQPADGTRLKGRWECGITVPSGALRGEWAVGGIEVHTSGEALVLGGGDLRQAGFEAAVRVVVDAAPSVRIEAPGDGAVFTDQDAITFRGTATVPEDGGVPPEDSPQRELAEDQLVWTSSLDGEIGRGTEISRSGLSAGQHEIVLTATAATGMSARDTVTIEVTAYGGVSFILVEPYRWDASAPGETRQFTARAMDRFEREIPDVTFTWVSSDSAVVTIDETGLATAAGPGEAAVIARVDTIEGRAAVTVGEPLTVTIESPADSVVVEEGDELTLTGSVSG
ncbi:MAG TPA: Ig-like domain-containing protein, partial [Longimicrobiales bacterium]|nr:Ig-like domain-containing protein [Longimicrobiales bacterium]